MKNIIKTENNVLAVVIFILIIIIFINSRQAQTRIVTVDAKGIMQEFIVKSASTKLEGNELEKHIQEYTEKFESLTRELAAQENFIILPKNAVIAGGVDITNQVKDLLKTEGGQDEKAN